MGGSPPSAAGSSAAHAKPVTYVVWGSTGGKGNTDGTWHGHGKNNDCSCMVNAWAATGSFWVNARTGKISTKSAPATLSISLSLTAHCSGGETGPTYAAEGYSLKSGKVKVTDPPSHFSVFDISGDFQRCLRDFTGYGHVTRGPACNAKILTSQYREGDAQTYIEIDELELTHIVSQIGCD